MNITGLQNREKYLMTQINMLNKKISEETSNSAKYESKIIKTKNINQKNTLQRKNITSRENIARYQKKIAKYQLELTNIQLKISKERDKQQKDTFNKLSSDNFKKTHKNNFDLMAHNYSQTNETFEKDLFISYAHEDQDYVDELVEMLEDNGISVYFDKNGLSWGGSIIEFIDEALKNCRFAIIFISQEYTKKYWTNHEFKGLLQRHSREGQSKLILPIWHNITADEVAGFNVSISDFNAMNTSLYTKEDIVEAMKKLIA